MLSPIIVFAIAGFLASLEAKQTMTSLFEPAPVVKQFPWINAVMQTFPESFVARMALGVGRFLRAKEVS
jgi:hypothetical protein